MMTCRKSYERCKMPDFERADVLCFEMPLMFALDEDCHAPCSFRTRALSALRLPFMLRGYTPMPTFSVSRCEARQQRKITIMQEEHRDAPAAMAPMRAVRAMPP